MLNPHDVALRSYLQQSQESNSSSSSESISQRIARLRLQSARERANLERRPFVPSAPYHIDRQRHISSHPGLLYAQAEHSDSQSHSKSSVGLAGPVPKSWRPSNSGQTVLSGHVHSAVLQRASLLSTLDEPFCPKEKQVLRLLDSCLLRIATSLPSPAEEDDESVQVLRCVPVHLLQRLMWIAQCAAPLSLDEVHLLCSASSQLPSGQGHEEEEADWDSEQHQRPSCLTALHLAFTPGLTPSRFSFLMNHPSLSADQITSLNLSNTPDLPLSQHLVSLLAGLPNLAYLRLASKDIRHASPASTLLAKLSSATPLLRSLDLSFNDWLDLDCIAGLNWGVRWLHLKRLGIRGTWAAMSHDEQVDRREAERVKHVKAGGSPRGGSLARQPPLPPQQPKLRSDARLKEVQHAILKHKTGSGTTRPWIDVVL